MEEIERRATPFKRADKVGGMWYLNTMGAKYDRS